MKSASPKPRLSAAHLFSGVAVDCCLGEIEAPNAVVCATICFILETADSEDLSDSAKDENIRRKARSEDEFIVSVAADSMTRGSYLISCRGRADHDRHQLDRCYRNALKAADNTGAVVAVVPVPTGGGTPEDRVRTAVSTVRQLSSSFENLRSIRFIADDERTFRAFRQRLAKQSGRSNGGGGRIESGISRASG